MIRFTSGTSQFSCHNKDTLDFPKQVHWIRECLYRYYTVIPLIFNRIT